MIENVENTDLTKIPMNNPIIAEEKKLIAQLSEQIAKMKVEMDKTRKLMNSTIFANTLIPDNGRPPLHFPTSYPTSEYLPINSTTAKNLNPPIIDSTTLNPHQASFSCQKLLTPQNPNTNNFQNIPHNHQISTIVQNSLTTQPIHIKIVSTTHFELDNYEKKGKEWKVMK